MGKVSDLFIELFSNLDHKNIFNTCKQYLVVSRVRVRVAGQRRDWVFIHFIFIHSVKRYLHYTL